jgi:hypothetical protein
MSPGTVSLANVTVGAASHVRIGKSDGIDLGVAWKRVRSGCVSAALMAKVISLNLHLLFLILGRNAWSNERPSGVPWTFN